MCTTRRVNWLNSSDATHVRIVEITLAESPVKILSENRQARFNFHLLETVEAGIALLGTEVKAAKTGKVQLKESYADILENEAWLLNAHISEYSHGNRENHISDAKAQAVAASR